MKFFVFMKCKFALKCNLLSKKGALVANLRVLKMFVATLVAALMAISVAGLTALPARAAATVPDQNVTCSGGGFFKIRGNKVARKEVSEQSVHGDCGHSLRSN
jgi:hypothetical protein